MNNNDRIEEIKKLVCKMASEDTSVMRGLIQKAINDELDKLEQ